MVDREPQTEDTPEQVRAALNDILKGIESLPSIEAVKAEITRLFHELRSKLSVSSTEPEMAEKILAKLSQEISKLENQDHSFLQLQNEFMAILQELADKDAADGFFARFTKLGKEKTVTGIKGLQLLLKAYRSVVSTNELLAHYLEYQD